MRKIWLAFAQATTIALGILLVVQTLRPDLLTGRSAGGALTITESRRQPQPKEEGPVAGRPVNSYSLAARKAMPSVVNISTSKEVKLRRHPFMDDPLFRRFFGDQLDGETQRASRLGSGVIVGSEGYFITTHPLIEAGGAMARQRSRREKRCVWTGRNSTATSG